MQTQVITIEPGGVISGLQRKPGQGIDLRQFGPAKIERASEIVWDELRQAWYVDVLQPVGHGRVTFKAFKRAAKMGFNAEVQMALGKMAPSGFHIAEDGTGDGVLLFESYDEAVKVEIAFLDALRRSGEAP